MRQQIVPVNSRVQGFVKKIYFEEYQMVHKGDTLLLIEDIEFRLRVAQAEADYQNALAGRSAMGTAVSTADNNLAVSEAGIVDENDVWVIANYKETQTTHIAEGMEVDMEIDAIKEVYGYAILLGLLLLIFILFTRYTWIIHRIKLYRVPVLGRLLSIQLFREKREEAVEEME